MIQRFKRAYPKGVAPDAALVDNPTGFVRSFLQLVGIERDVPDHSTVCRRQNTLDMSHACCRKNAVRNISLPLVTSRHDARLSAGQHGHQNRRRG
ncbi:transposase [uncultured Roseobacter sp.]|uniref:transposase n=1 Tax=uncultured Roseobacter sp. TaxID=114847 RepID=UPI0034555D16